MALFVGAGLLAAETDVQYFKKWELESQKNGTRWIYSRGYYAKTRKFGLRIAPDCKSRDLIVLWDTSDTGIEEYLKEGSTVDFELTIDDTSVIRTLTLEKLQHDRDGIILLFMEKGIAPSLLHALQKGDEMTVELMGSKMQMRYFDLPSDYFSLAGFTKAYNVTKYLCR